MTSALLTAGMTGSYELFNNQGNANEVIRLVNQVRASYGLASYQVSNELMSAAQKQSNYQASIGSITHTGANGSRPADRAISAGYGGGLKVYVSENVYGGNNASAQQAVNWWVGDAPHLATITSGYYTDMGAGVAAGGNTIYYTMLAGYVSGSPGTGGNATIPAVSGGTSAATAVVVVPFAVSTPSADGSIMHVVKPGQALWNIAAAYKVNLDELLILNRLTSNSFIFPGDKILVRKANPTSSPEVTIPSTDEATESTHTPISQSLVEQKDLAVTNTPPLTEIDSVITSQDLELNPTGDFQTGREDDVDPILLAIIVLVVLGTSLIFVGSVMGKKG